MISKPGVESRRAVRALISARHLIEGGEVTSRWIMKRFGTCRTGAMKDMALLRLYLPLDVQHRTTGPTHGRAQRLRLILPKGSP